MIPLFMIYSKIYIITYYTFSKEFDALSNMFIICTLKVWVVHHLSIDIHPK